MGSMCWSSTLGMPTLRYSPPPPGRISQALTQCTAAQYSYHMVPILPNARCFHATSILPYIQHARQDRRYHSTCRAPIELQGTRHMRANRNRDYLPHPSLLKGPTQHRKSSIVIGELGICRYLYYFGVWPQLTCNLGAQCPESPPANGSGRLCRQFSQR
jgi:hypothetical protein